MLEERALSGRTDARNVIERIFSHRLFSLRTVGAYRKAMGLVSQTLHEIEHGVIRRQAERQLSRHEKALAASIAVRPLRDARYRKPVEAKFSQHRLNRRQLPCSAIDQDKVRPRPNVAALGLGVVLGFVIGIRSNIVRAALEAAAPAGYPSASGARRRTRIAEPSTVTRR